MARTGSLFARCNGEQMLSGGHIGTAGQSVKSPLNTRVNPRICRNLVFITHEKLLLYTARPV